MYLNFLTDMYLFLIPIPMLWTAQLPKAKKIGLAVLFSGGLLTMIFGFLRGIAILKVCKSGLTFHPLVSRTNQRNKLERCYGTQRRSCLGLPRILRRNHDDKPADDVGLDKREAAPIPRLPYLYKQIPDTEV